jgi:alpha-L-rhamnosidase
MSRTMTCAAKPQNVLFHLLVVLTTMGSSLMAGESTITHEDLVETTVSPVSVNAVSDLNNGWFIDFGKSAFGTITFEATATSDDQVVTVHLGEVVSDDGKRINRKPGGSRRYRAMTQPLKRGTSWYRITITPDRRNSRGEAILMPEKIGEVMPFRYCELEGFPGELKAESIKQIRVHYPFDDNAAEFSCSDNKLNEIWELCKYTIKATSFLGVYVDGDRERIPYEADAYINQLGHYCTDTQYGMARKTLEHFIKHPTWPVEWQFHMHLMSYEEIMYSGDLEFRRKNYPHLQKLLLQPLARPDGLLDIDDREKSKRAKLKINVRTLVDWPQGERDGHDIRPVDSVVNAFYHQSLRTMGKLASLIGKEEDARRYAADANKVYNSYQATFFDEKTGLYRDGDGATHSSFHANFFPLAFGLVSTDKLKKILDFIAKKGMATGVYGAQHLLDGLYANGADELALSLLTSTAERSWAHMLEVGTTITMEAWDDRFKPNQDWNHAWGAAPANIIPRRLMGITPITPGFKTVQIKPRIGSLTFATMKHPTPLGAIVVDVQTVKDQRTYSLSLPAQMTANVLVEDATNVQVVPASEKRQELTFSAPLKSRN